MYIPDIGTAKSGDEDRVVDVMVLAFASDPPARWLFPEPHQYLRNFGPFTKALSGRAFGHDAVYHTADFSGAALWLPPGVFPDEEALVRLIESQVEPNRRAVVYSILEEMNRYHPAEPHWYLPQLGVDPAKQGRGCGEALLRYALERVDQDGKTAYLENTNPRNTPLYERHGFQVVGKIEVEDMPPILPMIRRSR